MGKKLSAVLSLILGVALFGFFLYHEGIDEVFGIFSNLDPFYIGLYFVFTTLTFVPTVWRWGIVLKAHGREVPFFSLFKYTLSGYAVSYVTPSMRLGGEPLRAYMLFKEHHIDLKTGSSSIIIEKFVELSGSVILGLVGLALFFTLPGLNFWLKFIFGISLFVTFVFLAALYHRSIRGLGSFSSLFVFLRLNRVKKWKNLVRAMRDVEAHMENFFVWNRKAFLMSFMTYLLYGILVFFEFKFLLLGLGISETFRNILLAITVFGFAGFVPVPAGIGFLEAGQSALFSIVRGAGSIGFALSLVMRVRALIFVAIGFSLFSHFSGIHTEGKFWKKSDRRSRSKKFIRIGK